MKRTIASLPEKELRQLVSALCAANKENTLLSKMFLNPSDTESLDEFKNKIDKAFEYKFSSYGTYAKQWSFREVKRSLSLFKKFSANPLQIAELHAYAVEVGTNITLNLGDIDGNYYTAMENLFESACDFVAALPKTPDSEKLRLRLKKLVDRTAHIGYSYPDTLASLFFDRFGDFGREQ